MEAETPYAGLTPDVIISAVEAAGFEPDGGMLALNSYENRVYQIGQQEGPPLVAKIYRPGRWSDEGILEEHHFSLELAAAEIPVVPPLTDDADNTLSHYQGFRFGIFPRHGGRWPELESPDNLVWIGRFLGRIHQVGAATQFQHRPHLSTTILGRESVDFLMGNNLVPVEQAQRYAQLSTDLLDRIETAFHQVDDCQQLRLHGDCHPGNILWTDQGPHFVDLDDCRTGPAIQDLWMLLSGNRQEMSLQLSYLREGYETFRPLDPRELALIEPLRTLRIMHYAAWIARRWRDPAFPAAFPWFGTPQYWQQHLAELDEQRLQLEQPPLALF